MIRRVAIVVLSVGLIGAACSTDIEGELETATAVAFGGSLPFVDDKSAQCLASGYLAELGVDGFAQQNLDVETIRADERSVAALIDHSPQVAAGCLDLVTRLDQVISSSGGELTTGCVDPNGLEAEPVVGFLLEPDASLDVAPETVNEELLSAARECIDDKTFTDLAGLPAPDEYLEVLIADPFARPNDGYDQDPCVNGVVFETLGPGRVDELGVSIDKPNLLDQSRRLTADEISELTTAFESCDLEAQIRRAIAIDEEQAADCIVASLDRETYPEVIENLFKRYKPTIRPPIKALIDECVTEALPDSYRDQELKSKDEELFVSEFVIEALSTNSVFERRCMTAGVREAISPAIIEATARVFAAEEQAGIAGDSDLETFWEFMKQASIAITDCVRPWFVLERDLLIAGVAESAWPCIRAELDPDELKRTIGYTGPAIWGNELDPWYELELGYVVISDAVELCASPADTRKWQNMMDSFFYGEGDLSGGTLGEVDSA